jgi:hypothetical protein
MMKVAVAAWLLLGVLGTSGCAAVGLTLLAPGAGIAAGQGTAYEGRNLVARAGDRTAHIELEKLTSRTTRMRITAKHGWFWRDRATAGEFIAQTERSLDDLPALTHKRT